MLRLSAPRSKWRARLVTVALAIIFVFAGLMSLPLILAADVKLAARPSQTSEPFPVSVDPASKTITSYPDVEKLLASPPTQLSASAGFAHKVFEYAALRVASLSIYQQLASVAGAPNLFVNISAGTRQEQVATIFGSKLGWTSKQRAQFLAESKKLQPDLPQGSTVPGIYFASVNSPQDIAGIVNDRFSDDILSHYSSSTEDQVPLTDAITIASLIQREAGGWDDMRMISGIIWNRLFKGMKLQIDATLQYAEANQTGAKGGWWPSVEPKDKYIKSAYNTYQHAGLPPAPIANPSIAAVIAALNPKKTDCLFYFHDQHGKFHCSPTYAGHVAMLKKYYGQGR
jgi:cell division protein YceG involved in septum cleavage